MSPTEIPLRRLSPSVWSPTRHREPITIGIPFPRGALAEVAHLRLHRGGSDIPAQVRVLDRWADSSIRWALIDAGIDADDGQSAGYSLSISTEPAAVTQTDLAVITHPAGVEVRTARATFAFRIGEAFPLSAVTAGEFDLLSAGSGLRIEQGLRAQGCRITSVEVHASGPLRAELEVRGASDEATPLQVFAKIEIFAGTATVRLHLTLRNPRRARHQGGQWPLGDKGSVLLKAVNLVLVPRDRILRARVAPEPQDQLASVNLPFHIHQESSGGDHWNSPAHRNRYGDVPLRFRGYRLRSAGHETAGERATPVVIADGSKWSIALAPQHFWEGFPQAVTIDASSIALGLLAEAADLHELQGGEQKTWTVVVAFAPDSVSEPALAWVHDPLRLYPSPEWCCGTGVMPFVVPVADETGADYLQLLGLALDPVHGFLAKRERADEFGWRHFGDLPADHESAFQPPDQPFVSHYNNQYDAIAAFAAQFLRTGDSRWWRLMDDLARHVRDVDIYHTREDKSAYNGGLFWHTAHYTDAGTATHRTYRSGGRESGGPAAEHNYNAGLMWHFFLTGDKASRDAAIGLAQWVIQMDDGRLTRFRWLASGATGLASASGSATYHGPGRGAANSVLACLVGWQLTGEAHYLAMAETLIRRCVHPEEDIESLNLLDVERRWYYTVFLQALGTYLHLKEESQQLDEMFSYARESLLHFSRWMLRNERPYLSHPEILEHKTETWAAQDMRKADVFQWAALHLEAQERAAFLERADFFFRYSVKTMGTMPGKHFTRPLVLMLSNGVRHSWLKHAEPWDPGPEFTSAEPPVLEPRSQFVPQKIRAVRRAKWLVTAVLVIGGGIATFLVLF